MKIKHHFEVTFNEARCKYTDKVAYDLTRSSTDLIEIRGPVDQKVISACVHEALQVPVKTQISNGTVTLTRNVINTTASHIENFIAYAKFDMFQGMEIRVYLRSDLSTYERSKTTLVEIDAGLEELKVKNTAAATLFKEWLGTFAEIGVLEDLWYIPIVNAHWEHSETCARFKVDADYVLDIALKLSV